MESMFSDDELLMLSDLVSTRKEEIKNCNKLDSLDKKEIIFLEKLQNKLDRFIKNVLMR